MPTRLCHGRYLTTIRNSSFIHSLHFIVLGARTGHRTVHNLINLHSTFLTWCQEPSREMWYFHVTRRMPVSKALINIVLWPVWPPRTVKCNNNNYYYNNNDDNNQCWVSIADSAPTLYSARIPVPWGLGFREMRMVVILIINLLTVILFLILFPKPNPKNLIL